MIQFENPSRAHFHLQLLWALAAMFLIVVVGLGVAIYETDMVQSCLKMARDAQKMQQTTSSGEGSPLIKGTEKPKRWLHFKTATLQASQP